MFVRDLDSTNGTFVNGNRIEGEVLVGDGDSLQIGSLIFHLAMQTDVPQSDSERLAQEPVDSADHVSYVGSQLGGYLGETVGPN